MPPPTPLLIEYNYTYSVKGTINAPNPEVAKVFIEGNMAIGASLLHGQINTDIHIEPRSGIVIASGMKEDRPQ